MSGLLSNWIHDAWKRREARRCALLDSEMAAGRRPVPRDNVCVLMQPRRMPPLPPTISPAIKDSPPFITPLGAALGVIDTDYVDPLAVKYDAERAAYREWCAKQVCRGCGKAFKDRVYVDGVAVERWATETECWACCEKRCAALPDDQPPKRAA